MTVTKVISGGQIGADIAGLRAASALGIPTGGWMPKGWRTLQGSKPEYEVVYDMRQHHSRSYAERTFKNVQTSDGTVRFAWNFKSPGERCTMRAIKYYSRPYIDVFVSELLNTCTMDPVYLREWLETEDIHILNVAGNADIWMEPLVQDFLIEGLR